jgi:O-methyltransferase
MKLLKHRIIYLVKGFLILLRPGVYLGFLSNIILFKGNLLRMTKWTAAQKKEGIMNDFFSLIRNYDKRIQLYEYIVKRENLENEKIDYLEFGVAAGGSFKWWNNANKNPDSKFYGFDTFEGLPEDWGAFKKGDMSYNFPVVEGNRHEFVKGLFQETMYPFLQSHDIKSSNKRIIHMDADLFSSTLFVLTSLANYLKEGDIVLFDEFNVPNHEFLAFKCFTDSYYIKFDLIGAVNNYYQVAFKIVK